MFWTILFWVALAVVVYAYVGYGGVLWLMVRAKRAGGGRRAVPTKEDFEPPVTFLVAAFNEERWIEDKVRNCLALDYPKDKITFLFVTDGSDDRTAALVRDYPLPQGVQLEVHHRPERRGKIAAVERVMPFVKTPYVIFTDANTDVNPMAVRNILRHYADPKVGAVAGEKRIYQGDANDASGAGEGLYWKYESALKRWDSELYSVVGAAGELFSVRTALYEAVPSNTIIEDFHMTLRIAQRGYRVIYEPGASATEGQSATVGEELKRKIRIAAGGLQAVWRLRDLLNPFRYGLLTFQYVSHRVLRWTLAPLALPLVLVASIVLALQGSVFFQVVLGLQLLFYAAALLGWALERRKLKVKAFFVPYYFCMMNYAVYRGFFRIIGGRQSVLWERAKRA